MKYKHILFIIALVSISWIYGFEPRFITDPAVSPDGNQICFVYQGDLWLVPFRGGIAKRLTSTEASETGPSWSPDGSKIAFNANREGQNWVYIMPSSGGFALPVFKDGMSVCDWFSDSEQLLCSRSNLGFGTSLYKAPLNGTKPILISEMGDYFSSLSPDNSKIIFNRYGNAYRPAYKGSTNGDLWEYDVSEKAYRKLTFTDCTERYPVYSHATGDVYLAISDGQRYQLNRIVNGDYDKPVQLSDFDMWSVRDISIARQNDRMAFELFDAIWCYDPDRETDKRFYKLPVEISEDNWSDLNVEETLIDTFDKYTVSDDELLIAFSYKYDLFVMPRKGGDVRQVTYNQNGIENLAFLNDNRTVVFTQYSDGVINLYKAKIETEIELVPVNWYGKGIHNIDSFYKSSEHRWVIEYTDSDGGGKVAVSDSDLNNITPILTDKVLSSRVACSPDGSMAIFATLRDDVYIRELYLYDFATEMRKKIMNFDAWLYSFVWMQDQKSILIGKGGSDRQILKLDLVARDEFEFDKDYWQEILSGKPVANEGDTLATPAGKDKKKAEKTSPLRFTQIDWHQIDKRISPILSDPEMLYAVKAIDDTSFYYIKDYRGKDRKTTLHKANIYGKNTSELGTFPQDITYQFVQDKTLYFKDNQKLKSFNLRSKARADINNKFTYKYNRLKLNQTVFEQVWGVFGRNFYDPGMHDNNWNELFTRFRPYLDYADNTNVLSVIIDEMIGRVNASHTGYYPRSERTGHNKSVAQLGVEFNQRKQLSQGIELARVYPGTMLYHYYGIRDGAVLLSINGVNLTQYISVDSLLLDNVDKKLDLVLKQNNKEIKAVIKGLSWSAHRELWFQDRTEKRRNRTDELSNHRIGYVLIPRMGTSDYAEFITDLFTKNADKEALIIDIRGNGGGRIHNNLLDFLSRTPNAFTTRRSSGAVKKLTPGTTWTKPIALLIDENSYSDAEIFPQLFKEAQMGVVIGMPTSGSVIGTWDYDLIDGSSMRMPGSGWYRLDGTNMEGNGAEPDIKIEMSLNDIVADNDLQLRKAVEVLLEQIK